MEFESIAIAAALALALFPLLRLLLGGALRAGVATLLVFGVALPIATFARQWLHNPSSIDPEVLDRPTVEPHDDYVSSTVCRACHPSEYASWDHSYHRSMTQEGVVGAVAGRFDDVALVAGDWKYRLERRGDEFWTVVEHPSADGGPAEIVEKPIVLTTGSHHYQVYWVPDDQKGVLRAFPFAFLLDEQKWIPRKAAFLSPPSGPRHTEKAMWNNGCAKCHSLDAQWRPVRPKTDTQVAELGISCEACHGPAEKHVRANRDPSHRYGQHFADDSDPTIVQPAHLDSRRSSEVCGQCHSISRFPTRDAFEHWAHHGYDYRPGDVLADSRHIVRGVIERNSPEMQAHLEGAANFLGDSFWSDGAVRIAGREYNGLLETPCFQRGEMSCLSCHVMHQPADDPRPVAEWADDQLKPGMRGNAACIQCHEDFEVVERLVSHTKHAPESSGSECQNCHMPYTTYGLLKAIRSHTIDVPSVTASLASGRPNACNQCHLDRSLGWAADQLQAQYGIAPPVLSDEERNVAASILWLLRGHAGQRALAAWTLGWEPARQISGGDWMAPYLIQLLVDPYDAVRFVAYRALRRQPGFAGFEYDSLSSLAQRARVSRDALAHWNRIARNETLSTGDATLLDANGRLETERIRQILARRDDRPVVFRE